MSFNQERTYENTIPGERWFPKDTDFQDDIKLYWGDWGVASEVDDLKAVLMRRPGKEIEQFNYEEVRFRENVNIELFRKQHDALVQIYIDHGVKVYYVEEQRIDRPNAVYCRDLMFMTPEGAIITRPGMAARRGEERYVTQALAKLGVPIVKTVNRNGIFEGSTFFTFEYTYWHYSRFTQGIKQENFIFYFYLLYRNYSWSSTTCSIDLDIFCFR